MDFDPKHFFGEAPRMKEDVRTFVHELGARMVTRTVEHARCLGVDRLLPRHVRFVLFQMSQDPLVQNNRQGICVQLTPVKSLWRVFARVIDDVEGALVHDAKYGGLDKRLVKSTTALLEKQQQKASHAAAVVLAGCIGEVCGIMLNSTAQYMTSRTMTQAMILELGFRHRLSNGSDTVNASLHRFFVALQRPLVHEFAPLAEKKRASVVAAQPRAREVHFENTRPNTPENCFWEE